MYKLILTFFIVVYYDLERLEMKRNNFMVFIQLFLLIRKNLQTHLNILQTKRRYLDKIYGQFIVKYLKEYFLLYS